MREDARESGGGGVGGVHEDKVAGFDVFDCALEYDILVFVAPVYRVASPHYHFVVEFFACIEHFVAYTSARGSEEFAIGVIGKGGQGGVDKFLCDYNFVLVLFEIEFCVVTVHIAVIAYFKAVCAKLQYYVLIFCRPYAAHEKGGFVAVLVKDFGDFFDVVGVFIDVEHKRHAARVLIALVNGVIYRLRGDLLGVRCDERYAEGQKQGCYYDKICAKSAESRFVHTIKYDCEIETM